MPHIVTRPCPEPARQSLLQQGVPPWLARLYAARGVSSPQELETGFDNLLPCDDLGNVREAAGILADVIREKKRLLIVADYDADGATACAAGIRALRAFGADVDYLVPNRFEYGYGLTPEIVRLAAQSRQPDLLVTVDNGIASVEGVAEAKRLGMGVLITDHHLPGSELPDALCIVNPNQPGCAFPSKNLAGVGVMFYLMLALRAELRARGAFQDRPEPNLAGLLDLVALGTVADVVKLDRNNRILVSQGLKRMRAGRMQSGISALFQAAKRDPARASVYDLGFMLGPRLNAAGRLTDMSLGIECLTTDSPARALEIAAELDALNRERREIEAGMRSTAEAMLEKSGFGIQGSGFGIQESGFRSQEPGCDNYSLCLYDPEWHTGVVGILASRIKDQHHRPVIAFSPGNDGELKGSGRSIAALHLRDALDWVAKRHPGLLLRFGGHAMAAGVSIHAADFAKFSAAFEEAAQALLSPADLERVIETDGALGTPEMTLETAQLLESQVWGQGFPQPHFHDEFAVENQRVVGEKHLKLKLGKNGAAFEAMLFNSASPLPGRIRAVYKIAVNEFNGARRLQLTIEHWEGA